MGQKATEETAADPPRDRPRGPLPIAGVGASAGGLAATTDLLRHLGPRPGVAVVIVHHLDPAHESSLVDILSRVTTLPVHTVSDGMRVERDNVYVVPPNAGLAIADGTLKLTPRVEVGGVHHPIDRLFESLAADHTVQALAVVLTGTGSDGTVGIKAIKAEGGVTFAQDETAEYASMPESAIGTGCVDFILPPEGIARELARIGARGTSPSSPSDDAPELQRVLSALRKASGIDFANYKRSTLRRRVQRRVVISGLGDLGAYAELVERDAEEARRLCEEILIHVTSFFRDPDMFEALKTTVFPRLIANRPRADALRVWVPGCSTGEEVYSIAICLLELLADAHAADLPVKLFGTDVSDSAIDRARTGKYAASIEQEVSPSRLQSFFTKLEGAYQIRKDVRDLCVFAKQDATRDPPLAGMDLISCRNLMIYLGPALQERVLPIFHYALKETGFLVLGTSESVRSFPGFATVDAKNKIYARTAAAPRLLFDLTEPRPAEMPPGERLAGTRPSAAAEVQREADRLILAAYGPPGVVITDQLAIVQFRGRTGPFLEPAPGVPSFDLRRMVREELRLPLRQAIDEARTKGAAARRAASFRIADAAPRSVVLEVTPFRVAPAASRFFLVLFREALPPRAEAAAAAPVPDAAQGAVESQLRQELASMRDYLQSVIEQLEATNEELRAANEEVVSSNEELRSTNEELQMAKEELQATNEELRTINDEMNVRNVETTQLNDDLTNVLSSVAIPILILGRDSRVRRFTPAAARVFHLIAADVGRPIGDIRPIGPAAELSTLIRDVLTHLSASSRTVQDETGRWYQLTARPYLSVDNRIDGTVLTAVDIDAMTRAAQLVGDAQKYAESIVNTVRECLVVVDAELRVRSANLAFHQTFGVAHEEIEGRRLEDLGRGTWSLPALPEDLEKLGPDDKLEGYRAEWESPRGERRTFVMNARHVERGESILLAFEDVTDKERAERALRQTETGFLQMLTSLAEAILMTDRTGRIVFANEMSATMFGYTTAELVGQSVDMLVPERLRADHAQQRAAFMAAPVTRRMRRGRELFGVRKDGTELSVSVVLGSMQQESGPAVMAFISDLTQRREDEERIRDYQARLQRMAFEAALTEERERRRIASDLHDRIGQSLALAQIKLASVRETLGGDPRAAVDEASALLAQSLADARTLVFDLSPPILYDLGLKEALSWLVEDVERRQGLKIELSDDGMEKPLDDTTASLLFRAVRELLMNVFKHARSPTASLSLRRTGDHIDVEVEDQGVGFDPNELSSRSSAGGGFGLFSVREQIRRLGGTLEVTAQPQRGTKVSMRVPIRAASPPITDAKDAPP